MKRLLYVSDSLIGQDKVALKQLLNDAQRNNSAQNLTGLLWTDGTHFAQVIEGEQDAVLSVLTGLLKDPRHENLDVVSFTSIDNTFFNKWSMCIVTEDHVFDIYEDEMYAELSWLNSKLSRLFGDIIRSKYSPED